MPVSLAGNTRDLVAFMCGRGAALQTHVLRHVLTVGLLAHAFLGVPCVQAQDEILINDDRLPRSQFGPRPARGSNGTLVVAWADGRNGPDASPDFDIYAVTIRDPLALGSTVNHRINDDNSG